MSHLLGLSLDAPASPSITLAGGQNLGEHTSGWGFAWYPSHEYGVAVLKDPIPSGANSMTAMLHDWDRFRGTLFLCHLRGAAKRASQEDTHPFARSFAGREWAFAHNGTLDPSRIGELGLGANPVFEPVGHTDSEHAFCWLLTQLRSDGGRRLSGVPWPVLHRWLSDINQLGTLNVLLTDGMDLIAYRDVHSHSSLHYARRVPPYERERFENERLGFELGDPRDAHRALVVVATEPMGEAFTELEPGQMIVVRRATVSWDSRGEPENEVQPMSSAPPAGQSLRSFPAPPRSAPAGPPHSPQQQTSVADSTSDAAPLGSTPPRLPELRVEPRLLSIRHETVYGYRDEVERSTHLLRLQPVHDRYQHVLEHQLTITPQGPRREFEDVFGNQLSRFELDRPYRELRIETRSLVRMLALPALYSPTRRTTIPLMWMPWQRQMMWAYLLPPELPETQLRELSDYAMSFVERKDYDLLETLLDINRTIHRDYQYLAGSTTIETTPFDVYGARRGVCQDFANLFICLARLLGVPARYRVGYIFTGADYENQVQSEASHAWAEVYLPWLGWRGFDPTNGNLAGTDHVRVACGRNYRDATPTSGTIYRGGSSEFLSVRVEVEEIDEA